MTRDAIGWTAASVGLAPLVCLSLLRARGQVRDVSLWWLALAFGVSFAADATAYFLAPADRWIVSVVFPVSQTAIVGLALLPRHEADLVIVALLVTAVAAVLWRGVDGPDLLLATVAAGVVVGITVNRWDLGPLRTALLVYFGVGILAWWGYVLLPGWWSWGGYQITRAAGVALFCYAALYHPVSKR